MIDDHFERLMQEAWYKLIKYEICPEFIVTVQCQFSYRYLH